MLTRSSVVWVAVVVGLVTGASSVGCSSGSSPGAGAGDGGVEPTGDAAHKADAPAQIDAGVDAPHLMGGYTVVTIATAQSFPGSVAVDDKNVYWAADGIMQVGKGGGTPITLTSDGDLSASSSHAPWDALAADGADVYYVSNGIMVTNLVKVPVGGGAITTLATGAFVTNAIALDSANV